MFPNWRSKVQKYNAKDEIEKSVHRKCAKHFKSSEDHAAFEEKTKKLSDC